MANNGGVYVTGDVYAASGDKVVISGDKNVLSGDKLCNLQ